MQTKLRATILKDQSEQRRERIAHESEVVREERSLGTESLSPEVRDSLLNPTAILQEARTRVRLQEEQELSAVDAFVEENAREIAEQSNSVQQKETRPMSEAEKQTHFKAEIHKLIDKSVQARFQAGKTLNAQRDQLLEQARKDGSQDPEGDFRSLQRTMYKDVEERLHKDIHAAFLSYGYQPDRQQVEFHANGGQLNDRQQKTSKDQEDDQSIAEKSPGQKDDQSQ